MVRSYENIYLGGKWVPASAAETIEVENPATEEIIGTVPKGGDADIGQAVFAAQSAQEAWESLPPEARADYLDGLARQMRERSEEMAIVISEEIGAPITLSRKLHAALPVTATESIAGILREFAFEEEIDNSVVTKVPVGVVGAVTPWNYPLHQIVSKVVPALAAGCTVVLKPSEIAPLSAMMFAELCEAAGLPSGVVNVVPGTGSEAGEALVRHPGIDMVSFTGSTRAGSRVASVAGEGIKKVSLELGGKSPNVVLPGADLSRAVKVGVANCFLNAGQTCTAWTRLLVHENDYLQATQLAGEAAQKYMCGDPRNEDTRLGPVVSALQRDRVRGYIERAVADGGRVVVGGAEPPDIHKGYYVQATVIADVDPMSEIAQEEVFGPVLTVLAYQDEEEAARLANGTPYGLGGGVWGATRDQAVQFARRLRMGQVDINGGRYNAAAPFGGFKQSGYGRELGRYGLEEFLVPRSLQV